MSISRDGLVLRSVLKAQVSTEALKDGTVTPAGVALRFEEVTPIIDAFRRMVRSEEFDLCEMALATYVCAREHGRRFSAIPVFVTRGFHHQAIFTSRTSGIRHPKELEGKRVGVSRGYTVTTGVWARAILQNEFKVNLDSITWVISGDEHVAEYRSPANVVRAEGRDLNEALRAGDLAAVIGIEGNEDLVPLIQDSKARALQAFREQEFYPVNHTVVIRDALLAAHPWLARELFAAFATAKRSGLKRMKAAGLTTNPTTIYGELLQLGSDPLPYGLAPNRRSLAAFIRALMDQRIISNAMALEELFDGTTLDLVDVATEIEGGGGI